MCDRWLRAAPCLGPKTAIACQPTVIVVIIDIIIIPVIVINDSVRNVIIIVISLHGPHTQEWHAKCHC